MKKSACALTTMALMSLILTGCQSFSFTDLEFDNRSSSAGNGYQTIDSFEVTDMSSWLIWGLVPLQGAAGSGNDWVKRMVGPEIERLGGDAAVNVTVTQGKFFRADTIVATVVTYFTGWMYIAKTYTISGDIVKYTDQ